METFSCSKSRQKSVILVNAMSIFTERGQRRELEMSALEKKEALTAFIFVLEQSLQNRGIFRRIFTFSTIHPILYHCIIYCSSLEHICNAWKLDASSSLGVTSMNMSGDPVMMAVDAFPYLALEGSFRERQRGTEKWHRVKNTWSKKSFRLIQVGTCS